MKVILKQQADSFFLDSIHAKGKAKSHLLCIHGLNQNPESFKPLLLDLVRQGISCHLLHLPGHLNDDKLNKRVTKDMIFEAYENAYNAVRDMAEADGVPYSFLGYSFGGLIGTSRLEDYQFNKVILLAPAIKLRPFTHGLRPFLPMLSRVVSVPLGNRRMEERYRFHHRGVPRAVYKTFFEIYDQYQFRRKNKKYLKSVDGLVFVHPRDELVSYRRLRRWLRKHSNWELKQLSNRQADFGRFKHLIIDETTLGKENYKFLLTEAVNFLLS
jgi:alpha-beta hydrolase superfamily lysophospholipase